MDRYSLQMNEKEEKENKERQRPPPAAEDIGQVRRQMRTTTTPDNTAKQPLTPPSSPLTTKLCLLGIHSVEDELTANE